MSQAGMTLIELLLCVVIMAVLLTVAVPHFHTLGQQYRVRAAGMAVYAGLQWARSEAIKRNKSITVCFSGSGTTQWRYQIAELTQASDCNSAILQDLDLVSSQQYTAVILTASYPHPYLVFKPRRSALTSGNITLSQGEHSIKVITWNNSIIRTCSNAGLPGVPPC